MAAFLGYDLMQPAHIHLSNFVGSSAFSRRGPALVFPLVHEVGRLPLRVAISENLAVCNQAAPWAGNELRYRLGSHPSSAFLGEQEL